MKDYKCVIFDLDGTLIDAFPDMTPAMNKVLAKKNFPLHTEESLKKCVNRGARVLCTLAIPEEYRNDEKLIDEVFTEYTREYSERNCKDTRVYEGIPELLKVMKAKGIKIGLVSNKDNIHVATVADKLFSGIFDIAYGNREGYPRKPDPTSVIEVMEKLGANRGNTLYVGDSVIDMETAKNAGLTFCGVLWGFKGKDSFPEEKPEFVAENAKELAKIINVVI